MFGKRLRKSNKNLLAAVRMMPCSVCGRIGGNDASHIKTRGSGGDDAEWNVVSHCRMHHIEWGQKGWSHFLDKYPHFARVLHALGWSWESGRLINPRRELH